MAELVVTPSEISRYWEFWLHLYHVMLMAFGKNPLALHQRHWSSLSFALASSTNMLTGRAAEGEESYFEGRLGQGYYQFNV